MASAEEGQRVAGLAAAARDVALKEAKDAQEWCRVVEAEQKTLRDQQAAQADQLKVREEELKAQEATLADRDAKLKQAAQEQAMERGRLEKLKAEVEADQASLTKAEEAATMSAMPSSPLKRRPVRHFRSSLGMSARSQR